MVGRTAPEGTYVCHTTTPPGASSVHSKPTLFKVSHKDCITQIEWLKTPPAPVAIDRTAHIFDGHIFELNPHTPPSASGRSRQAKDVFGHYNPNEDGNPVHYEVSRPQMPDGSPYDERKDQALGWAVIKNHLNPTIHPQSYLVYTEIMMMANNVFNWPLREQAKNPRGNPVNNAWNAPVVMPSGRVAFVGVFEKVTGRPPTQTKIPFYTVYPAWESQKWYEDHIQEGVIY